MEKDNRQTPEEKFHYYSGAIRRDMGNLLKWLLLAVVVGCIAGAFSTLFSFVLKAVTRLPARHICWTFFLLPLFGLCIVFLYEKFGKDDGGTNQVLSTVRSQDDVPWRSGPLIFISTALTHLAGGSAGREGAAIQLGGSIANLLGRWIHLDEEDRHVIVMCGMSAAFSALFGTPMAAAVFSLEVVSVGVMYYTALMPCMIASLIAPILRLVWRYAGSFSRSKYSCTFPGNRAENGVVALGCAVISIVFCIILNETARFYGRFFSNKYARVVAGAVLVIFITLILGTTDYMGAGAELIEKAVETGDTDYMAFFWKMLLTALTMKAGFRGGEIVPSFCVGATFGCMAGQLIGLSPSLCAACGMAAVFCGVTNCPITSILIAFEMFGFKGVSFYLIAVSISYAASGYYGLYKDQTIVYSKYKAKYINKHTKM